MKWKKYFASGADAPNYESISSRKFWLHKFSIFNQYYVQNWPEIYFYRLTFNCIYRVFHCNGLNQMKNRKIMTPSSIFKHNLFLVTEPVPIAIMFHLFLLISTVWWLSSVVFSLPRIFQIYSLKYFG